MSWVDEDLCCWGCRRRGGRLPCLGERFPLLKVRGCEGSLGSYAVVSEDAEGLLRMPPLCTLLKIIYDKVLLKLAQAVGEVANCREDVFRSLPKVSLVILFSPSSGVSCGVKPFCVLIT
jgi:hypothetical protein